MEPVWTDLVEEVEIDELRLASPITLFLLKFPQQDFGTITSILERDKECHHLENILFAIQHARTHPPSHLLQDCIRFWQEFSGEDKVSSFFAKRLHGLFFLPPYQKALFLANLDAYADLFAYKEKKLLFTMEKPCSLEGCICILLNNSTHKTVDPDFLYSMREVRLDMFGVRQQPKKKFRASQTSSQVVRFPDLPKLSPCKKTYQDLTVDEDEKETKAIKRVFTTSELFSQSQTDDYDFNIQKEQSQHFTMTPLAVSLPENFEPFVQETPLKKKNSY